MTRKIKTIIIGLGPIGERITKTILGMSGLQIVGAVDLSKDLIGKDLGRILKIDKKIGVTITDDLASLLSETEADLAVIATTSYVRTVYPTVISCIKAGLDVLSSCEELVYPWLSEPELASKIDHLAKKYGVTVLSTGVNPGYFMDTLPLMLTAICREVKKIEAVRVIKTGLRRESFQRKIGTGMLPSVFLKKIREGKITGHVGFRESIALTAAAIGLKLDEIIELPPKPVIANRKVETIFLTVKPGEMLGYENIAKGVKDEEEVIIYKLIMHAGIEEGYQEYTIEGIPNIKVKMSNFLGDWETAHIIVNMIPKVINSKKGLLTMKDMPLPCAVLSNIRALNY
jgi:4-hydroxy-tetrahydrodipicolinate reductase